MTRKTQRQRNQFHKKKELSIVQQNFNQTEKEGEETPSKPISDRRKYTPKELLEEADLELKKVPPDLIFFSEKVWLAASTALKLCFAKYGIELVSHSSFKNIVRFIQTEFKNKKNFGRLSQNAETLHRNFYKNELNEDEVKNLKKGVKEFVNEIYQFSESKEIVMKKLKEYSRDKTLGILYELKELDVAKMVLVSTEQYEITHEVS